MLEQVEHGDGRALIPKPVADAVLGLKVDLCGTATFLGY